MSSFYGNGLFETYFGKIFILYNDHVEFSDKSTSKSLEIITHNVLHEKHIFYRILILKTNTLK